VFSWTGADLGGDSAPLALQVAVALGAVALLVTLGLTLQVLAMRAWAVRERAAREAITARWRPLLLAAAAGDAVPPPPLARHERSAVMLLWNRMQDGLRGRSHDDLNAFAQRMGLDALARRYAARRGGARRLIGLRTLGHLGSPDDWPRLAALLDDPRSQVSLAAARALLRVDAARAAGPVIDQFLARTDWPVPRLGTLLREAGADAIGSALADRLLDSPPALQVRLLPLARVTEAPGRGSVIEAVLARATDPAVLSATLQQVHGPGSLRRVRELCAHADWQVRSYAALALGRLADLAERPRLTAMLGDREWWVRYRAAQALLGLPGMDAVAVQALRAGLTDRYARDMIRQVAAERGLVEAAA
jgi:HEAT repeat protein